MFEPLSLYRSEGSRLGEIADREHMQIRRKHQDLRASILEGVAPERILNCSSELILSTMLHLESQERAMAGRTHQCLLAHRRLHDEIIASLTRISEALEQRKLSAAMELLKFFEGRVSSHFEFEDAALERQMAN